MNTEEKEIQNVTSDSEDQGTSTPVPSSKKKRNIPAIVASVIAFLAIVSSISKPSPDSYQALQEKYNKLKKDYTSQEESLELVTNQYDSYKNQMSAFDDLSDEEIDALVSKADEILAEKQAKEDEAKKAQEEAAKAEAEKQQKLNSASTSQKNALAKAKGYLGYTAFSYKGLIEQLEYEGFSSEDATYGADNCGADWTAQADKKAADYMGYSSFSRASLIEQLEYEGFTQEQAEHGASSVGL